MLNRVVFVVAVVSSALLAQEISATQELLEQKLMERIKAVGSRIDGVLGVAAIDLTSGHVLGHHADVVFPQASSIKIPIMMQVYEQVREGKLKLNDMISIAPKDAVQGSGHLRLMVRERAVSISLKELIVAMIETSDNTATNKLIALAGMGSVNAMLDRLGFRKTRLQRIMLDSAAAERNDENVSTPLEMARLAELLYRGKAINEDTSREMVDVLKLVTADFRRTVPSSVVVASKPGELTGVRCETGIIFVKGRPFVLSVASSFLKEPENPVPAVAKLVYDHFAKLAQGNRYGNLGVR